MAAPAASARKIDSNNQICQEQILNKLLSIDLELKYLVGKDVKRLVSVTTQDKELCAAQPDEQEEVKYKKYGRPFYTSVCGLSSSTRLQSTVFLYRALRNESL